MRTSRAGIWSSSRRAGGRTSRAFTLVELIVVIAMLGICAATVFPKVSGMLLREPEPRRSARRFLHTARYAQQLAIAGESALVLQIDTEAGSYRVENKDGDQESAAAPSLDLRGQLSREVLIAKADFPGSSPAEGTLSIEFRPDGWCDPVVLRFTALDGQTATVVIPEWAGGMELLGEGPAE